MTSTDGDCLGKPQAKHERDVNASNYSFLRDPVVTARLPTDPNATHYNMNHKRRGIALIFNHESFKNQAVLKREGTNNDAKIMNEMLDGLGFEVTVHHNFSLVQLQKKISYYARYYDHSDCDCFVMVILTHGGKNGLLHAHDKSYNYEILWKPFSADVCPTLAGKPKLFFNQACRGEEFMTPVILTNRTETDGPSNKDVRIPSKADFLFAYSTIPGYLSWRSTSKGSWFIQALCEELKENVYQYDILTILTFVNRRVALDYETNNPDEPNYHERKQIPCISSRLIRLVKFNKKNDELLNNVVDNKRKILKNMPNTSPKNVNLIGKQKWFLDY